MAIEQTIAEKVRVLPAEKQQAVLDFVEFLQQKGVRPYKRHSPIGLCADLKADITEADIAEARREMWGSFREMRPASRRFGSGIYQVCPCCAGVALSNQ